MYKRLAILEGHWEIDHDTNKYRLMVQPELKIFGSRGTSHTSAFTSYINPVDNHTLQDAINMSYFIHQQKMGFGFQDSKMEFDPVTKVGVMELVELNSMPAIAPRLVVHNLGQFTDELDSLQVFLIIAKSVVLSMCRFAENRFAADLDELDQSAEPGIEKDIIKALRRLHPPGEKA